MREDGVHQLCLGRFQGHGDDDSPGSVSVTSAPIMCAPSSCAGLGVEHRLDHALGLAQRDRLAVADEGEAADLDLAAGFLGLGLGQADRGDLRRGNRCSRGCCAMSMRMRLACPAMCSTQITPSWLGLVRQPGRRRRRRRWRRCRARRSRRSRRSTTWVALDLDAERLPGRGSRHCRRCRPPRSPGRRSIVLGLAACLDRRR